MRRDTGSMMWLKIEMMEAKEPRLALDLKVRKSQSHLAEALKLEKIRTLF